jgi:uncharacterized protein YkwD
MTTALTEPRTAAPLTAPEPPPRSRRRPALALLAVVVLSVAAAGCMPGDARTFLDRTNDLRDRYGLRAYHEHDTLTAKAEDWARYMARTGSLQHSNLSSDLGGLRYSALGENVGVSSKTSDTLLTIHNMFVSSSPHRANLLSSSYTHMGVGVATDSRGRVWVAEVFARL